MKKTIAILTSLIMIMCMSGCALVPSLDLTEPQQKVIAEYAAGLLLKYDKNYSGSLKRLEEDEDDGIGFVENEEAQLPVSTEEIEEPDNTDMGDVNQPDFDENLTASEMNAGSSLEYSSETIGESIGLDSFEIIYKSYETHEIFPEEQSNDLVFSMQAQNGMELLVVNFGLTNDSPDRKLCDVINQDCSFRLLINGSERVNASRTILLNDLSSFSEEIEGYGMTDVVLVFEVAEGTSATINNLDLIIKKGENSSAHMLK